MTEDDLKAQALSAASAARFSGFVDAEKALREIAKKCNCSNGDCGLGDRRLCRQEAVAGWLELA